MSILASAPRSSESLYGDWTCWHCGFKTVNSKPNSTGLCGSCKLVRSTPTKKGNRTRTIPPRNRDLTPCKAWLRDFDDLDHPIHPDGTLVAPGERVCGFKDCVEPTHVIGPDDE